MIPVARGSTVRTIERDYFHRSGVPSILAMEVAARAVAEVVRTEYAAAARDGVRVVCGAGSNGGDGYACARWLAQWGFPVRVWSLHPTSAGDAAAMRAAALAVGVGEASGVSEAGMIVDAIFGTGLSRAVGGIEAEAIRAISSSGLPVVAVDVPSGIHADTGAVLGVAVRATTTVTFGAIKQGLVAEPGADFAGRVQWVDIGLGAGLSSSEAEQPAPFDLRGLWPSRAPGDHKNRAGHLVLVAGSTAMAGAAVLAARGALAAGVGLLSVVVPTGAIPRLAALPPEAMVRVGPGSDVLEALPADLLAGATALAAGPGLGGGRALAPRLIDDLRKIWIDVDLPLVFDADALGSVAVSGSPAPRVMTPHPGEAGRMLGVATALIQSDRFAATERLSAIGTVLLKGRNTLVATRGAKISVNPTNSPSLATGGSGDVLLGLLGGLLARGVAGHDAARLAAWVHGRAGERRGADGFPSTSASDIADALAGAMGDLLASGDTER